MSQLDRSSPRPEDESPSASSKMPSALDLFRDSSPTAVDSRSVSDSSSSSMTTGVRSSDSAGLTSASFTAKDRPLLSDGSVPGLTIVASRSVDGARYVSGSADRSTLGRGGGSEAGAGRGDVPTARAGESLRGGGDRFRIEIPDRMKYGAAANPWDRLGPMESTALKKSLGDLMRTVGDRKAAREETTAAGTIKRDDQGRILSIDKPGISTRIHLVYDGKSKEASALVIEKKDTGHKIALAAVDPSGKSIGAKEWVSLNSRGEKKQWFGQAGTTADGKLKLGLEPMKSPAIDIKDPKKTKTDASESKKKDKAEDKPIPETLAARESLIKAAGKYITNASDRADYLKDLAKFESGARKAGHSSREIADFYKQSERLLRGPSEHVNQADRARLARECLKQAIDPTQINQGFHKTCNTATVEVSMYTRNPSLAVKAVTEAALTGRFKTADGSSIVIPKKTLEAQPDTGGSGRSFASQVFQELAVNVRWQRSARTPTGEACTPGDLRYSHGFPKKNPGDTGQRMYRESDGKIISASDGKTVRELNGPMISLPALTDIYKQIAGKSPATLGLCHERPGIVASEGVKAIASPNELHDELTKAAATKGGLPLILRVHTGHEPWYTNSGAGKAGGSGGWHVVTITGYDPTTKQAAIDNTWGKSVDHSGLPGQAPKISLADVYRSMTEPPPRPKVVPVRR